MGKLAIIDVDSFLYKGAVACSELVELQKGIYYEAYNLNKAIDYLKKVGEDCCARTSCEGYLMVTGGVGENFRLTVNPSYKENRKKTAKPIMLDKVREEAFKQLPIVYIKHLEADDTCRIMYEEGDDNVICSIDKDLATFPSKLYNPDTGNMRFVTPAQAESNFKRQLLIGDKTDGYSGLPKIGPATANKMILDGVTVDDIAEMYVEKGLGIDEFKKVYNCAMILGKKEYNDGVITLYGGEKLDTRLLGS